MKRGIFAISFWKMVFLLSVVVLVVGCVATMGVPVADPAVRDMYTFKIAYGRGATWEQADTAAHKAIKKFKLEKGYKTYRIVNKERTVFPFLYISYVVQFYR